MNSKKTLICSLALGALLLTGCRSSQKISSSFATFDFKTTCMGVAHDGTQALRAWGTGADKSRAVEQAKKNAVFDVIFNGIPGDKGCRQTPLVTEVNARERYSQYFDRFFSPGGEYTKFVRESSDRDGSRVISAGTSRQNYGVVVDVDVTGLRRQLIDDGVLSPSAR